ncbi:hypothetical protein ICN41_00500 [Polynucleobacter sp. 15G-AUS-farblos]|uniref:hypothetical protein n=1 Tax=Polynucleobacter sp. 15G-AUS-farblos TaxID=2689094 RepID=UPI001C0C4C20|nr:hypothetical protein [Polynucleobacter sp. 15G-AUS-farblos]MBU3582460.1 hypothetical protein [Polynucleobacter sp. 15G-AUS-farblos]
MNSTKLRVLLISAFSLLLLSACGSMESAAQDDCTSIGWQIGSPGYNDCYRARLYERKMDYALPPGDRPRPSLL